MASIRLLCLNIQGAKPYNRKSQVAKTVSKNASKILKVVRYAREQEYSVILLNETHSERAGDIRDYLLAAYHDQPDMLNIRVFESVNTT